jgi:hypothetical protein
MRELLQSSLLIKNKCAMIQNKGSCRILFVYFYLILTILSFIKLVLWSINVRIISIIFPLRFYLLMHDHGIIAPDLLYIYRCLSSFFERTSDEVFLKSCDTVLRKLRLPCCKRGEA